MRFSRNSVIFDCSLLKTQISIMSFVVSDTTISNIIVMLLLHNYLYAADIPCPPYQHTCDMGLEGDRAGRCVDVFRMCDGFRDCLDQSDELGCRKKVFRLPFSVPLRNVTA